LSAASPETFASQTATASLSAASPETFASQTATASFEEAARLRDEIAKIKKL